jgi:hypothetical protein
MRTTALIIFATHQLFSIVFIKKSIIFLEEQFSALGDYLLKNRSCA